LIGHLFEIDSITTTEQIHTASPAIAPVLQPATKYWNVGRTAAGQVNWNLGDGVFGEAAYQVAGDGWTLQPYANVSAFALLGEVIPEPSALLLMTISLAGTVVWRRR